MWEVVDAKKQISQRKAPGEPEILKRCDIDDKVSAYSSIVANLINRVPLTRTRPKIDPCLRYNQNDFRPGRSTITQVLALRDILEGVKNYHLPSIMVLIDFSKAFVSINHQAIFNIAERTTNAIMLKCSNIKGKVLSPDGETDYF